MKTIRILALTILQTILFILSGYILIRLFTGDNTITGTTDVPLLFLGISAPDLSPFFQYAYVTMFLLFLIANLSALIRNKLISFIFLFVCILFAGACMYLIFSGIALFLWFLAIVIAVGLMVAGYMVVRKVCR